MSTDSKKWDLDQFQVPEKEGETRFHDFDLALPLMQAIADAGFQYCTPIQAEVLHHTLAGADAIGRAQTGTGKTAAFLITIINDLLRHPVEVKRYAGEPRALIVAPTRELAQQIEKDAHQLCKHSGLKVMSVVGGMNFTRQQETLHTSLVDILVATPGRLLDFANRRDVWLDRVEVLVLDEADRMLDMGFIPDVKRIVRLTPQQRFRQTLLFSATFNQDVMNLASRWTETPSIVEIEPEQVTTETVDQKVFIVETEEKFKLLKRLIDVYDMDKVIIFANRRDITRRLCDKLQKAGIKAQMISGDVPQVKRSKTLENFRSGKIRALVATDVAGRGIHIDGVTHVVNYNLPEDPEDYVHRIGRTGRAGKTGVSISFACEEDAFLLPELEKAIGMKLECEYPPEDAPREEAETAATGNVESGTPEQPEQPEQPEKAPEKAPEKVPEQAPAQARTEAEPQPAAPADATPASQADQSPDADDAKPDVAAAPPASAEAPAASQAEHVDAGDEQTQSAASTPPLVAEPATGSDNGDTDNPKKHEDDAGNQPR